MFSVILKFYEKIKFTQVLNLHLLSYQEKLMGYFRNILLLFMS